VHTQLHTQLHTHLQKSGIFGQFSGQNTARNSRIIRGCLRAFSVQIAGIYVGTKKGHNMPHSSLFRLFLALFQLIFSHKL
jgi:hypothetical protein